MSGYHGQGYPALLNDYITRRIVSDSQLYPQRASAASDSSENVGWKRVGNPALENSDVPMFKELLAIHNAELDFLKNNLLSARKIVDSMKLSPSQLVGDATSSQPLSSTEVIYDTAVQTLQGIETHMKTVEVLMKNLEALRHPIRTLPTELLKIIMEAAVEADEQERRASIFHPPHSIHEANLPTRSNTLMGDDLGSLAIRAHHSRDYRRSGYAKVPTAVLLSHVCRRWREVACSTPSLWRIIRYSLSGQPDSGFKSWDRVRLFLQRADHDPLSPNNRAIDHGISLIFTNWMEHTHPPPADSLRKVMRMLSKPDRTEREWTTETPSHSRRQSAANSTFNALTPPLGDLNEYLDPEQSFIIKRFEIVFDTLCEHPNSLGTSRNAELLWPTGCPRPKEVAYIARDNVYKQPAHDEEDTPDILTPPYAKSLIPWARDVTLYNLRYPWPEMDGESAYKRLAILRIHFTCDFERMLEKPRSEDNLGFLQFLKMAPNLTELEIRLPQRTVTSSSDLSTIRRPDPQTSTPPPLKASLTHLLISYRDLLEIIPLFMPNPAHPGVPTILLPTLHKITFLPETQTPDSTPTDVQDSHTHLIDLFLQRTEAKITHIGFGDHGQLWRKLTTPIEEEGDTDIEVDPREEAQRASRHQVISSLIKQFPLCETLEICGQENVDYMLDILGIKVQKKGAGLETTPKKQAIPWPEVEPLSSSKANPKQHLLPEQPLHAEPASIGTDVTNLPLASGRHFKERSTKRNSRADSWLAVFSGGGSPANVKPTKSPSPAPSQKNEGKKRVKEIIASVMASGPRPAARVRTPEHTPRIAAKDLVSEPTSVPAPVNNHGRVVPENTSNPSAVTDTSANNRASVSLTSTPEHISTSIPPSRSPLHANNEQILSSLERVIIRDAAPDDLKLKHYFNHHGIRADIHR